MSSTIGRCPGRRAAGLRTPARRPGVRQGPICFATAGAAARKGRCDRRIRPAGGCPCGRPGSAGLPDVVPHPASHLDPANLLLTRRNRSASSAFQPAVTKSAVMPRACTSRPVVHDGVPEPAPGAPSTRQASARNRRPSSLRRNVVRGRRARLNGKIADDSRLGKPVLVRMLGTSAGPSAVLRFSAGIGKGSISDVRRDLRASD